MLKICIYSPHIYSLYNKQARALPGGSEIQLSILAEYLIENGFEISVLTADWGQKPTERFGKITVFKTFKLSRNLINMLAAPFLLLKGLHRADADCYISSSASPEVGIIALFCKLFRKRHIYRSASSIDCDGTFIKKNGIVGILYAFGLRLADVVVVQTEENKRRLWENHKLDSVVIKNSFKIDNLKTGSKDYVLWVGRAEKNKNPEIFLELAKKFVEEKFIMIAPKQEHLLAYFNRVKKQAEKIKNVTFIERVPFNQIQNLYNGAKLFVCTSQYEGFPNTHLQACMGGTPIVSLMINPDNYINNNMLGYCANNNVLDMEKNIERILENKKEWEDKCNNALKYVKKNHDIITNGKKWINVINN